MNLNFEIEESTHAISCSVNQRTQSREFQNANSNRHELTISIAIVIREFPPSLLLSGMAPLAKSGVQIGSKAGVAPLWPRNRAAPRPLLKLRSGKTEKGPSRLLGTICVGPRRHPDVLRTAGLDYDVPSPSLSYGRPKHVLP